MSPNRRRLLLMLVIIFSVVVADQFSKQFVIDHLEIGETTEPIPALVPYFQITRSYNTGAAFGILPQTGDLILVIAVVVVGAMLYYYPRLPDDARITRLGMALLVGGALGNAIDRVRHEHVIDFIHYRIPDVISNVSNLADHAIVLGVGLILLDNWRMERLEKRQMAAAEADSTEAPPETLHE